MDLQIYLKCVFCTDCCKQNETPHPNFGYPVLTKEINAVARWFLGENRVSHFMFEQTLFKI